MVMSDRTLSISLLWLLMVVAGCASGPRYDESTYSRVITPSQVGEAAALPLGKGVLWGGVVVEAVNLPTETRIEVVAYPLDGAQRPQLDRPPLGRFIGVREGYLEALDYTAGRRITVSGLLVGGLEGRLGESRYRYPLVRLDQLHRWPDAPPREPRLHFGIGVLFSR